MSKVQDNLTSSCLDPVAVGRYYPPLLLFLPNLEEISDISLIASDSNPWFLFLLWVIRIATILGILVYSIQLYRIYSTRFLKGKAPQSSDQIWVLDNPSKTEEPENSPMPIIGTKPNGDKKNEYPEFTPPFNPHSATHRL
jgi:hypothetical protein